MDDFSFGRSTLKSLAASSGQGSRVTEREGKAGGDKSVTVSVREKEILHKYHSVFPRMSLERARDRGEKTHFEFRLFPDGRRVTLSINHPKSAGAETRNYFKKDVFYPRPFDFWFLYESENEVWIGALPESDLALLMNGTLPDAQDGYDQYNEVDYQAALNEKLPSLRTTTTVGFARDAAVAKSALHKSGYSCEMLPLHPTFQSRTTRNPYLEAHHFLPMFEQRNWPDTNLDVVENICILNPYAHKMVHHATYSEIEGYLKKMAEPREDFLKGVGVTVDRVLQCYGGP